MKRLCSVENCGGTHYAKSFCKSHYNKQYKQNNHEENRRYDREYKALHRKEANLYDKIYSVSDTGRFAKAKTKAKQRRLDFTLSLEDFLKISNQPCHYCQDELCGREIFQGAHLDRIDNSLGYILGNVLSCGLICNKIRMNNLTVEETEDAVQAILEGKKFRLVLGNKNV